MREKVYIFDEPNAFITARRVRAIPPYYYESRSHRPVWFKEQGDLRESLCKMTPKMILKWEAQNNMTLEHGVYCCKCRKVIPPKELIRESPKKEEAIKLYGEEWYRAFDDYDVHLSSMKEQCPYCGQNFNLRTCDTVKDHNTYVSRIRISEDGDKISLAITQKTVLINPLSGCFICKNFGYRYVFNCRTGQAYALPYWCNGKKKQASEHIQCITYSSFIRCLVEVPYKAVKELARQIFIKQNYPEKLKDYMAAIRRKDIHYKIGFLALCNRFPMLTVKECTDLFAFSDAFCCGINKVFSKIKPDCPREMFISNLNIGLKKCKTVKKLLSKDISTVYFMDLFFKLGCEDTNLLENFVGKFDMNKYYDMIFSTDSYGDYRLSTIKKMTKELIKLKGEPWVVAQLIKYSALIYLDAVMMFKRLKDRGVLTQHALRGCIQEIHDRLSTDINKLRYANVILDYPDEMKNRYNRTVNGLDFVLARETDELIRVGQRMGICVGGYYDKVADHITTIVVAYKDDLPVICIEITRNGQMKQVSTFYNHLVQGSYAYALKEWVAQCQVKTCFCSQYEHIERNQIIDDAEVAPLNCHDFHTLEIDEDGNVFSFFD